MLLIEWKSGCIFVFVCLTDVNILIKFLEYEKTFTIINDFGHVAEFKHFGYE